MISKEEIIKTIVQSAAVEVIVEKRMESKTEDILNKKFENPSYELKENIKQLILEILEDKEVREKIKKIGGKK
jgi:hypothetical protein